MEENPKQKRTDLAVAFVVSVLDLTEGRLSHHAYHFEKDLQSRSSAQNSARGEGGVHQQLP
jgi:hypothetical protein